MALKDKIINSIIDIEGGYSDDPLDSGGETNFGITEKVARANGYVGDMIYMPRSVAFDIYGKKYWDSMHGDDISAMSEPLIEELTDTAVNMGVSRASKFLQRALNVFNKRGKLYSDIVVDGNIGPATIRALKSYLDKRDENVMLKALNCLQGAHYVTQSEHNEEKERFTYGWFKNRVRIV